MKIGWAGGNSSVDILRIFEEMGSKVREWFYNCRIFIFASLEIFDDVGEISKHEAFT